MRYDEWARENDVTDLSPTVAAALAGWVEGLPWGPARLDWSAIPHVMLYLPSLTADEILRAVAPVLGGSAQVAVLASAERAVLGSAVGLITNLDEVTYHIRALTIFLFPVLGTEIVLNRLLEIEAPDRLRVPLSGALTVEERRIPLP